MNSRALTSACPDDVGAEAVAQILQTCLRSGGKSPFTVRITDAEGTQIGTRYLATSKHGTFRRDARPLRGVPRVSPTGRLVLPLQIAVTDDRGRNSTYTVKGEPKPKEMIE